MADLVNEARARQKDRHRGPPPTETDSSGGERKADFLVGATTSGYAGEERTQHALCRTKGAAWLLERALESLVEENELSMPTAGQLYVALQEVRASAVMLEARRPRSRRRGEV